MWLTLCFSILVNIFTFYKSVTLIFCIKTTEADLDLHSASEDDEEEMFVRGPAHESENEADEEHEEEEELQDEQDPVVISKASFMYREPEPASSSQPLPAPSNVPPAGPLPVDDDSVTGEGHLLFALSFN